MYRVALVMGLMMMSVTSVDAAETREVADEVTPQVFVMNNYQADVRVYIEDAEGKLHSLGRLTRGSLGSFQVPEDLSDTTFRVKVFPAWGPGSMVSEDIGIGTNELDSARDEHVRVWVETNLTDSIVEIARD